VRAASTRKAFRRTAVQPQHAQKLRMLTLPAAVRGLVLDENPAFMQPGGASVLDNFFPGQRGLQVRGGCKEWCSTGSGQPIISSFSYLVGWTFRMFVGTADTLWDATYAVTATSIKTGQSSGNYCASQLSNQGGDWMLVVNDGGDYPLRFNGTTWETLDPSYTPGAGMPTKISGPPGSAVEAGHGLTYVWKYRNRYYFIEGGSMNLWFLDINAVGGLLGLIPLSGAATKGGSLLFGSAWSIDAGDGIDDKNIVVTSAGEVLVFTGNDPTDPNNWRQEGRYAISAPLGMNAHIQVGGDILIATVDGIIPVSACIHKERVALELAAVTRSIGPMWEEEVYARRDWPWMMYKWDERGVLFVTLPGGDPGEQRCLVANVTTGAWGRFTGWDATTFVGLQGNCYFGTQDGRVMQAWQSGTDNGAAYVCCYVGGWEHFGDKSALMTWRQARSSFFAPASEPFIPQITATTDYNIRIPTPPNAGTKIDLLEVWDQALWDDGRWDQEGAPRNLPVYNTHWLSIGETGYAHAPIVQITVSQTSTPRVGLISVDAVVEPLGTAV
jgi:hypothetical protein